VSAYLNDFWKFNISSSQWTWLSGNNNGNNGGVYGTIGIPSIGNYPGSRSNHQMVLDSALNCIYLFAGYGFAPGGIGKDLSCSVF
jgi:hypothetical protein